MFKKKKLLNIFKVIVSCLILFVVLSKIDWQKSFDTLRNANLWFLLFAILINSTNRLIINYKLFILLKVRGVNLGLWKLFNINMIGAFWATFLPSSLSADLVRGFYLLRTGSDKAITISSIVVDRVLGVFSLLTIALLGLLLLDNIIPGTNLTLFVFAIIIIIIIGLFFLQLEKTSKIIEQGLNVLEYKGIGSKIIKLKSAFLEYKKYPKVLIISFILSVLVQFFRSIQVYIIALAFSVYIPLYYLIILIPIIMILIMLPISFSGLGVREGAYVGLLKFAGVDPSISLVISLMSTLINTIVSLYGGIAYIFFKTDMPLKVSGKVKTDILKKE